MPLDGTATTVPNHVHHQCLIAGFSFSFQSHPELVDEKAVDAAAQTPTQMDPCCRTVDVEKVRAGDFSGMLFAEALLGDTRSPLPHMSAGFLLTPGMGGMLGGMPGGSRSGCSCPFSRSRRHRSCFIAEAWPRWEAPAASTWVEMAFSDSGYAIQVGRAAKPHLTCFIFFIFSS